MNALKGNCNTYYTNNDESKYEYVKLSPNPFKESTILSFSNLKNDNFNLQILDITGRIVRKTDKLEGNSIKIEKGNLVSGVYFVQINQGNNTWNKKLIIE